MKDSRFKLGLIGLGSVLVLSFLIPIFMEDQKLELSSRLCAPSSNHLLGCDLNGGDVLISVLRGGRVSLIISFITVFLTFSLGLFVGLITGYWGGVIDNFIMGAVDLLMAFPGILLALFMTSILGPSYQNIIIAMCITGWIGSARLIRGQAMSLRSREHVQAAVAIGQSHWSILTKHIFPLCLAPLIVHSTFSLSGIIIVESSLSFLGLGPQEGILSWGGLLSQGKTVLIQAPWLTLAPGAAIMITVLSLNFIGDSLRDFFDPKSQN